MCQYSTFVINAQRIIASQQPFPTNMTEPASEFSCNKFYRFLEIVC